MKLEFLYDQGISFIREDGLVANERLFGVLDGVSAPHSPKHPPKLFDGLTGGEMVVRLAEDFLSFLIKVLPQIPPLRQFIIKLNELIDEKQKNLNVGERAGAVFAFALIKKDEVEIVQTGDCFAIIEKKDGEIVVSPNQVRHHDEAMNKEINSLMHEISQEKFKQPLETLSEKRLNEVKGEMWNRFCPILIEARRQDNNNPRSPRGFGILNGDPRLNEMIWERKFPLSDVSTILLFTDGMVPWKKMEKISDEEVARHALTEFHRGGLARFLLSARETEKKTISYISRAEASAVAITF